jgi:hypothetical protein
MQTHNKEALKASIKEAMPAWLPRAGLTVADNLSRQYRVYFPCPCHGSVKPTVKIPTAGATHQQMVNKLVQNVTANHRMCYEQWAADETVTMTAEQHAAAAAGGTAAVGAANRKKRQLEVKNELLTAEVKRAAKATGSQKNLKRQSTCATTRIEPIDRNNKEELSIPDKHTAVTTPFDVDKGRPGGLLDCIRYWARGSICAVLQLVMALITHFHLEQEVKQKLVAEQDYTNQYIVNRARDALSVLKCCDSEQQRREYRIVLTALMPEAVKKGDPTGMQAKVAKALGVNRNRPTFKESVARRVDIDKLAATHMKELKVGDAVVCKRTPPGATSTLTSLPTGS